MSAVTKELESLRQEVARLRYDNAALRERVAFLEAVDRPEHELQLAVSALAKQVAEMTNDTIPIGEAVNTITSQLMLCDGRPMDYIMALDRARNIVAGLVGMRVGT